MLRKLVAKTRVLYIFSIIFYAFRIFSISEKKVIFSNFNGKGYGDSPKCIAEMLKEKKDYELYWVVKKDFKGELPDSVQPLRVYSLNWFYHMATAKVWVANSRMAQFVRKRPTQFYLQTWHSPLRMKKIELDARESMTLNYLNVIKQDSKNISLMIAGCDFSYEIYKRAFDYSGDILKCGTPRCDIFFDQVVRLENRKKVRDKYGIGLSDRVILYAPTFRVNQNITELVPNFSKLFEENNDMYVLLRFHPRYSDLEVNGGEKLINSSSYPDIQELICASDFLITDYSSCCFDALIANVPCILYTPDLEEYLSRERELYFEFEELPFPLAKMENELFDSINSFDIERYDSRVMEFEKYIHLYEDGRATQRAVQTIINVCENKSEEIEEH